MQTKTSGFDFASCMITILIFIVKLLLSFICNFFAAGLLVYVMQINPRLNTTDGISSLALAATLFVLSHFILFIREKG